MIDAGPRDFHRRWSQLESPLRPPPEAVAAIAGLIAGRDGLTLQLGVTPEIATLPARAVALDWEERMVRLAAIRAPRHHAVVADWRAPPLADASIATVIGDASLNALAWPPEALWRALRRVLAPDARIVLRCFAAPEPPPSLASLVRAALAGDAGSFAVFKLRFNMAVAGTLGRPTICCDEIFAAFAGCFPDRAALVDATGWSAEAVSQFDLYAGSAAILSYPSRSRFLAELPWPGRFVEIGGYAGAEHCPLLVIDVGP